MKITRHFKQCLLKAQAAGYKRVYVTIGRKLATTYCSFVEIETLLAQPIGTWYVMDRPTNKKWKGWPNTRHITPAYEIQYREVFTKFGERKARVSGGRSKKQAEGARN